MSLRPAPPHTPIAISAITASELIHGVHRAQGAAEQVKRQAFVNVILGRIPCAAFDLAVATIHAQLGATLATQGIVVGAQDLIIAATALSNGYDVATRDLRSFPKILGLGLASW